MTMRDASRAVGMRTALVPLALLVMLGVMWGLSLSLGKIATIAGVHPLGLVLWQAGLAACIVLGLCAARGRLRWLSLRHLRYYVGCGLLSIVIPAGAIYTAAPHIPAGVLAILVTTVPMVTYLLALGMRLETFSPVRVAGILLGFIAVLMIVGPRASLPAPDMTGWVLVAMVAPVCYGLVNVFIARFRPENSDSTTLAAGALGAAALIVAPVALLSGNAHMIGPPWDVVDLAVVGLPMITGIAHAVMFELIRMSGPVFFSQVGYLVTAAGVLWGMAIFGERHSPWVWAALVLMFAGLALVNARRNQGGGHEP